MLRSERLGGRDVMGMSLNARRDLLERRILPKLGEPIRYSPELHAAFSISLRQRASLEGLVAKRRDSRYEPGSVGVLGGRCGLS